MSEATEGDRLPFVPARNDLRSLTSLRFFAAAIVVVFHCGREGLRSRWTGDFFQNGLEAVSFFFVLSGFILTYVYASDPGRPVDKWQFWAARAARICPIYWIALLISLPQLCYATFVADQVSFFRFIGAFLSAPLLIQSWFPHVAIIWNMPAWSLSVEAFFYLLFPFLVGLLHPVSTKKLLIGAIGAAVVIGGARTFAIARVDIESEGLSNFINYFPLLHLPQFIVGIGIARLFLGTSRLSAVAAEVVFVAACITVIFCFWARTSLPKVFHSDAVLVPLYALLIYSAAEASGITSRALAHKSLVLLGEISYGVYILHIPLYFLWIVGIYYTTGREIETLPGWTILPFFALVLLLSLFLYRKVEMPCRIAVKRWAKGRKLEHLARFGPVKIS